MERDFTPIKENKKLRAAQDTGSAERWHLEKLLSLEKKRALQARSFLGWQRHMSVLAHEKQMDKMRAEVCRMQIKMKNAAKFLTRFTAA